MEESGFALGGHFVEATAMFSDIRGFTTLAESQSPADTIELLNTYYTLMFEAISGQGGVINQMVGDGLMAIFGAPLPLPNHSEQAVRAALEMIEMIDLFNLDQEAQGKSVIRIGIGIATGQVIAGYTGTQRRATYTCVGDTVNLAARLEAYTKVAKQPILIDETTRIALSETIKVQDLGTAEIKGKNQEVRIYSVVAG
jgi:class 3 adenylate cyclase